MPKLPQNQTPPYHEAPPPDERPVSAERLTEAFGNPPDLTTRPLLLGGQRRFPAAVLFLDGMVNGQWVSSALLRSLNVSPDLRDARNEKELFLFLEQGGAHNQTAKRISTVDEGVGQLLSGCVVVVPEGEGSAFCFEAKGFPQRSVAEPLNENIVKGARDAFIENLRFNTALLRRKISNPALRFTEFTVGRQTKTRIAIAYMEGITNTALVAECERRARAIDTDGVVMASMFEEYMTDHRFTPFPQFLYTERVDRTAHLLLQGRVVMMIDGLPLVYAAPCCLSDLMKTPEDFASHAALATMITLLRHAALLIALLLPAFYLAVVTFHPELIPTSLTMAIIESKEGVPFPSVMELLIMLISFEILLESSIRMPQKVGGAVSIVGALVVGQAAVEASLVTSAVVIVVALAGIAGFTLPNQDFSSAIRLWRALMVLGAAVAGFFGMTLVGCLLIYHLARLQSLGMPYLTPFTGQHIFRGVLQVVSRIPMWLKKNRPEILQPKNIRRQR